MSTLPIEATSSVEPTSINAQIAESWGAAKSWRRTLANALIITDREVRDSFRDWRIVIPIFMLTLVFPVLANFASGLFVGLFEDYGSADTEGLVDAFLPLMPMLVGFFPVSISLVIALETFVGEKERLSLEPLLSTPLTNAELYIGKVLAAIIPPLAAGYLGISLYVGGQVIGQGWRPDLALVVQIMLLTTVQAIVMVTGAVVISSQTTSTRAANLLASFVIIPMSLLVIGESLIMIKPASRFVLWYVIVGLVVVVILLMRTGVRIFNREELLGRAIDHINLRWVGQVFKEQWRGGSNGNPLSWYRLSVLPSLRALRPQMIFFLVCALGMFIAGWYASYSYQLPLEGKDASDETVLNNMRDMFELGMADPRFVMFVLTQNVRVLLLVTLLSSFSFGVLGMIPTTLIFGVLGYVIANIVRAGISPIPVLIALIPHGIFEIPAIMIAAAGALRLGAIVTSPNRNMTVGESWIRALADVIKLGMAVVFPLLVIAAVVEVQLTPRLVEWILTQ